MRITVKTPKAVYHQLKAKAAMEGRPVEDLIICSIRRELKACPPRRHAVKFPLIRGKEKRKLELDREQIDEVILG